MEKMNGKLVTFTGIIVLVLLVAIFGFLFWEPKPEYIQGEAEATEVRISGKVPGRIEIFRFTWSETVWFGMSSLPNISASVFLVMSSLVGPSPPVMIAMSDWPRARSTHPTICALSSPIETFSCTTMPAALRWRAMDTELVSTI